MLANIVSMTDTKAIINEKRYFDYQERFLDVADDATITFKLSAVTKDMHLVIIVDAEGKSHLDSYENTTFSTNGTEQTTFNRFIDNAPDATSKIYLTPTVTTIGDKRFSKLILGGTGPQSTGSTGGVFVESVLSKGYDLYLVITNKSGQAKDYGVTIEWYEE